MATKGENIWRGETTQALTDIKDRLAELHDFVKDSRDRTEAQLKEHAESDTTNFGKTDTRLRKLETAHAKIAAVSGLLGALVGGLGQYVAKRVLGL